jgi:transposase
MAQQRLPMRNIRDVLRLSAAGLSKRKIAASLGIGATAAGECLGRARQAGVGWPLPDDMTDAVLEARLYPASTVLAQIKARRPQPDWPMLHRELKRKGVTLQLVWEEHRAAQPDGFGYSRFCELYRAWEGRLAPTMRQTHVAGEKLFVDYAGMTMDVIDGVTGEVLRVQLFVAAHGASSYTFAEATWTQTLPDWIGSHTRAFTFFGGVAAMVVSDNLKSGITKVCFYETTVNRKYAEMAAHLPAEPYVYAEWKECKLGLDYHVEVEKHYYSAPHQLLRQKVWVRITARTVEVLHGGKRVAAHVRSSSNRKQ